MKWFGLAATFSLAFLLGVVATSFAAKGALPYMMFKETKSDLDHERTLEVIRERVAAQDGWKITAEIDQRAAILLGVGRTSDLTGSSRSATEDTPRGCWERTSGDSSA